MKGKLDPDKFIKAMKQAIEKVALESEKATIDLLKAKGDKCFVVCTDDSEDTTGRDLITFCAVGLDKDGNLIVGGTIVTHEDEDGGLYEDPLDPDFADIDNLIEYVDYPAVYRLVANNIDECSCTKKEAEAKLSDMADDNNDDDDDDDDDE